MRRIDSVKRLSKLGDGMRLNAETQSAQRERGVWSVGAWERWSVGAWECGSVGAWERGALSLGAGAAGTKLARLACMYFRPYLPLMFIGDPAFVQLRRGDPAAASLRRGKWGGTHNVPRNQVESAGDVRKKARGRQAVWLFGPYSATKCAPWANKSASHVAPARAFPEERLSSALV